MPLAYRINEAKVIHEIIDGDAIMINLDNGNYYSMNEAGVYLWSLLQQGAAVADMTAQLSRRFQLPKEQAEKDFQDFVSQLQKEELVSDRGDATAADKLALPVEQTGAYAAPKLMVFSDMQELLLLDPIHEISEQGWPHIQKK